MAKGNHKNLSNKNQDNLASSEPSFPTTVSPGYPNTLEKQDSDLKITTHDDVRVLEEGYKEEWIQKMWYIYTMEYYSAIKNNDYIKFLGKWMELENMILSEKTQSKRTHMAYTPW